MRAQAMSNSTSLTTPAEEVNALLQQASASPLLWTRRPLSGMRATATAVSLAVPPARPALPPAAPSQHAASDTPHEFPQHANRLRRSTTSSLTSTCRRRAPPFLRWQRPRRCSSRRATSPVASQSSRRGRERLVVCLFVASFVCLFVRCLFVSIQQI